MKLQAKILPLKGKYYGTEISITSPDEPRLNASIEVLISDPEWLPSERELGDESLEEWKEYCCDNHYESRLGYRVCQIIEQAINGGI